MAKLSSHGTELFRIDGICERISYRSDGHILRDTGAGWKLYRRFKRDLHPDACAAMTRERYAEKVRNRPAWATFRDLIIDLVPKLSDRRDVYTAISLLEDDPDGLWSTLDDHLAGALSIADCAELCEAYTAMQTESLEVAKF